MLLAILPVYAAWFGLTGLGGTCRKRNGGAINQNQNQPKIIVDYLV